MIIFFWELLTPFKEKLNKPGQNLKALREKTKKEKIIDLNKI